MQLHEKQLQSLRRKPVPGRYSDGDGLSLLVNSRGGMYWQWQTTGPNGKRTDVSYGPYPLVPMTDARQRHREAKRQKLQGVHPTTLRRKARAQTAVSAASDFQSIARAWHQTRSTEWSDGYAVRMINRLEKDVIPWLGKLPIDQIDAPTVLTTIRRIQSRGAVETAHRMRDAVSMIFRFAIAAGLVDKDPAAYLRDALQKPHVRHMAAITDPSELGALLRAINGYQGSTVVRTALQLAPLLMVRPGELRRARWEEIDLSNATWTIPAARMKRRKEGKLYGAPHLVPLPRQAVALLTDLSPLTQRVGCTGLVFRGERDHERPMSENTINAALRRMGYDTKTDVTGHGFRATARTILDEVLGFDRAVIEMQLAHTVKDINGRAYNRTNFLEQRRQMMQSWADYLDGIARTT
jgi:integrase